MRRVALGLSLALVLGGAAAGQNQKPQGTASAPAKKRSPDFIDKVLEFLGISDSPSTLKGPGDEVVKGRLWLADLDSKTTRPVGRGDGYRSPLFIPESNDILALSGSDLVRFSARSGEPKKLYPVANVAKLVASNAADPGNVLILQSANASGHLRVGLLSLSTGKVTPLAYDPGSSADLQMVENLEGWVRTYGDKKVYVRRQTKQALSGVVEWSDVFLKDDGQEPINVSRCNGANCGQPSLSTDGRLLVFVKTEHE